VLLDCCHAGGVGEAKAPGVVLTKSPLPLQAEVVLTQGSGRVIINTSVLHEIKRHKEEPPPEEQPPPVDERLQETPVPDTNVPTRAFALGPRLPLVAFLLLVIAILALFLRVALLTPDAGWQTLPTDDDALTMLNFQVVSP
jgi:hypothetical protein